MNWPCAWKWPREAISDSDGVADVAYVSLFVLIGSMVAVTLFLCGMDAVSYFRCVPLIKSDVIVNCTYNPLPLGQALGLVYGAGFSTGLGGLTAYMVATRKQPRPHDAPNP